MRGFYVLVHGRLSWLEQLPDSERDDHAMGGAEGFYCHRYVLGGSEREAAESAFVRVRKNLEKQTDWFARGLVTLELEADEVTPAPMYKLLKAENRGHTFYLENDGGFLVESEVIAPKSRWIAALLIG